MKILLVEDERHIAQTLDFNFRAEGYETCVVGTGEDALERLAREPCDILVLDVMLPGIDGFEVARRVREEDNRLPILMLTALSSDEDRIAGLECGVDDYLVKPFVLKELMLRIRGLLRRAYWHGVPVEAPFAFGNARIEPGTMTCRSARGVRALTQIELDLLRYFASNANRPISRQELLEHVWGYDPDVVTRTVDTFVMRLRKFVEPEPSHPRFLKSVRGKGYIYVREGGRTE